MKTARGGQRGNKFSTHNPTHKLRCLVRLTGILAVPALLSRQRSRVRVSSSPPFFLKHLRWFSRNHRGPKRARFSVLFCVPFRSVPFLRCRFPHAARSPHEDRDVPNTA